MQKTIPVNLICLDQPSSPKDSAALAKWKDQLGQLPQVTVQDRKESQIAWPLLTGECFVMAGTSRAVVEALQHLEGVAKALLTNRSYYWIVTDAPKQVISVIERLTGHTLKDLSECGISVMDWKLQQHLSIKEEAEDLLRYPDIKGLSIPTRHLRREIGRIGKGVRGPGAPTLILGETGAGKELVAKSLHSHRLEEDPCPGRPLHLRRRLSVAEYCGQVPGECEENQDVPECKCDGKPPKQRSGKPCKQPRCDFYGIASALLTSPTLESRLFGHVMGAYTDATADRDGVLRTRCQGTVFIDDFDRAKPEVLGALLRLLDTPKGNRAVFPRFGEDVNTQVTFASIVFATNRSVQDMLDTGDVHEDFIFRCEDRVVTVAPLRERLADIPSLARHFWDEIAKSKQEGDEFPPGALLWLCQHMEHSEWKGNVRALRSLVSLAASLSRMENYKHLALWQIMASIMERGPNHFYWMGIMKLSGPAQPADTAPMLDKYAWRVLTLVAYRGDPIQAISQLKRGRLVKEGTKGRTLLDFAIGKLAALTEVVGLSTEQEFVAWFGRACGWQPASGGGAGLEWKEKDIRLCPPRIPGMASAVFTLEERGLDSIQERLRTLDESARKHAFHKVWTQVAKMRHLKPRLSAANGRAARS